MPLTQRQVLQNLTYTLWAVQSRHLFPLVDLSMKCNLARSQMNCLLYVNIDRHNLRENVGELLWFVKVPLGSTPGRLNQNVRRSQKSGNTALLYPGIAK